MIGSRYCLSGYGVDEDSEPAFVRGVEGVGGDCAGCEVVGLGVVEGDLGDGV